MTHYNHIIIIGGGIAGLATAFYLQRQNPAISYTLLEGSDRLGGKIVTETTDNFVIEGGPDSFISQKPWGTQLCRDLGLADRLIPTNDDRRNIYVLRQGKLIPFPSGYRLTVPTEFIPFARSPLISPAGKLRMAMDLVIPRRKETGDESLASFMRRRLGQEALDMIGEPMMASIYTANPEKLSIQSTFPMFVEMEQKHGSLIKAMQIAKREAAAKAKTQSNPPPKQAMFTSLQGGMQELVTQLEQQLTGNIRCNSRVVELRKVKAGYEVVVESPNFTYQTLTAEKVVLALPAYDTAPLISPFAAAVATELRRIRYVPTATVSLGYRRADIGHELDGFGFLIPKSEQRQISACTWSSTKFNHRADENHALLRLFVGGEGQEKLVNLSDVSLITLARMELFATMGISAQPILSRIYRWSPGTPQYDVGHLDRVALIESLTAEIPGLYLTGSAFRGIGIPDCVKSALTTVSQLVS